MQDQMASGAQGVCCADQLFLVVIFNLSLSLEKVLVLCKISCMVPVPKTPQAKEPNHNRPVTLTSDLMETMESLSLSLLHSVISII